METGRPKQTYFDETERNRIRRALLRYMEENRIGVPTLQRLVADANDIVVDRVPLKTLQRFLGDTHRSNDAMVRFCQKFIAGSLADDPLDRLGEQLAAFHAIPMPEGGEAHSGPPLTLDQCAGAFEGIGPVRAQGLVLLDPNNVTNVSDLSLTVSPAADFARAAETVTNWRNEARPQGDTRRAYEGVAVVTATGLLVALRNMLTGTPRTYWLTADADGLAGQGAEPVGSLDRDPPSVFDRLAFEKISFRRAEADAHG